MGFPLKPTVLTEPAFLFALGIIRTPVPIDALQVITIRTKLTWRHPTDVPQRQQFVFVRLVMVIVGAGVIGAVVAQEIYVTHFHLFDTLDLIRIVLDYWIDSLTVPIARNLQ